jgi:hypothetical protein
MEERSVEENHTHTELKHYILITIKVINTHQLINYNHVIE